MSKPLPRQAILVVNAMSRRGADVFGEARDKLIAAGIDLIDAYAVDKPEDMDPTVKKAIERAPMVIVGGGDGSLSSNVEKLVLADTPPSEASSRQVARRERAALAAK